MYKKLLPLMLLLFLCVIALAQGGAGARERMNTLKRQGYAICHTYDDTLREGGKGFFYVDFEKGVSYRIVVYADQGVVHDLGLNIHGPSGQLMLDSLGGNAIVADFVPAADERLKVTVKNMVSVAPGVAYTCYMLIGCK